MDELTNIMINIHHKTLTGDIPTMQCTKHVTSLAWVSQVKCNKNVFTQTEEQTDRLVIKPPLVT